MGQSCSLREDEAECVSSPCLPTGSDLADRLPGCQGTVAVLVELPRREGNVPCFPRDLAARDWAASVTLTGRGGWKGEAAVADPRTISRNQPKASLAGNRPSECTLSFCAIQSRVAVDAGLRLDSCGVLQP
jgi:hypothetical protein